jgi:hypothetical protein
MNPFFQIYFLVVLFALYNGLVFLPVMLSLFGPPPKFDQKFDEMKVDETKVDQKIAAAEGEMALENLPPGEEEKEAFVTPSRDNVV